MIDAETIHDYLDGRLDEGKARELMRWLMASPSHRAQFRNEIALAIACSEVDVSTSSQRVPENPTSSNSRSSRLRTVSARYRRKSLAQATPPRSVVTALAALVLISATVMILLVTVPSTRSPGSHAVTQPLPTAKPLPRPNLVIGEVHGPVSVVREQVTLTTLPTVLLTGDQLQVGALASVRLDLDHGRTRLWVDAETSLSIATLRDPAANTGTRFDLARGRVRIDAAPQLAHAPLRIRSARSEATVVGTLLSFDVTTHGDRLVVGHGAVDLRALSSSQQARISTGEFGTSDGQTLTSGKIHAEPPVAVNTASVDEFILFDENTNRPIPGFSPLRSGSVIDMKELQGRKFNIRAKVSWPSASEIGYVVFDLDGKKISPETTEPYSLLKYYRPLPSWLPPEIFSNGIHSLVVTPYVDPEVAATDGVSEIAARGKGAPGHSALLIFTIINATSAP